MITLVLFSSYQVICKSLGGHLAVIETPQEQSDNASPGEYILILYPTFKTYVL